MSVTVLHLTDFHLYADAGATIKGIVSRESFEAVLDQASETHAEAKVMVLGGDLAQDESLPTYRWLAQCLRQYDFKYLVTPGNHCKLDRLREGLEIPLCGNGPRSLDIGGWRILGLNTHWKGRVGGMLSNDELAWMDQELQHAEHVLIAMHHHPFPTGSAWLDDIALNNAHDFWQLIQRHDNVRGIVCGHVHQAIDDWRDRIRLMSTPSTCIQFKPCMPNFALDNASPGYRWICLDDSGSLETGVVRIEGFIPPDLSDTSEY
ncbi:MAG: serine/threonine protein phosphatase [Zetaproteobacteria bacterium]|nr:MAG: serine/threonine protein phosphatase [Zetaproteobacteria bacterium]